MSRGNPRVTGVLPVALESAAKALMAVLNAGKEYVAVMKLHGDVPKSRVKEVMSEFVGPIYQVPPVRASVKRRLRTRTIYELEVLEIEGRLVLFRVACEAGTYVRKLCVDIGRALGCGAHMQELRRTRVGSLSEDWAITLHELSEAVYLWHEEGNEKAIRRVVVPMERMLSFLPKIIIRDSAVDAICHGAQLAAPGVLKLDSSIKAGDMVLIMTLKGEAVALAEALVSSKEMLAMRKGLVARTLRVLMKPGTYPKMWSSREEVVKGP